MRSLFAAVAAIYFINNALAFLPADLVHVNEGAVGGLDGDAGAVAVTWAARALFGGLAILSLAAFEWSKVAALWRRPSTRD
jgi:hypothetical protein